MSNILCNFHTKRHGAPLNETSQADFSFLSGLRVLVVDDNTDCLYLITAIFEQFKINVKAVTSVDKALETLEKWKPDVLVSDICMPDKDGFSLIRTIRTAEALKGGFLPAIAITSYTYPEIDTELFAAGFQELIFKPFDFNDLVTEVVKQIHCLSTRDISA